MQELIAGYTKGIMGKAEREYYSPKPTESQILSACIKWLYDHGLQPIRNNTGSFSKKYKSVKTGIEKTHHIRVGKKGTGDILVCTKRGQWCEIEVKSHSGTQQPEQKDRQEHIARMNGLYILARSIDDLEAWKTELCK